MIKDEQDIFRYVLVLTTFYEKVTAAHPKKDALRKSLQSWKQQTQTLFSPKTEDDDSRTFRTTYKEASEKRPISPSKPSFVRELEAQLPDYSTFMFKDENDFLRVFAFTYLVGFLPSAQPDQIEQFQADVAKSTHLLDLSSFAQSVAARKINLIMTFLVSLRGKSEPADYRTKLEKISYEDKTILSKIIRIAVLNKKPAVGPQLTEPIPNETTLKIVAEVLGIRLSVYEIQNGQLTKGVFGKGNLQMVMAFDRPTKTYLSLYRKVLPSLVRTQSLNGQKQQADLLDKTVLFTDILNKINANSEQLEQLKCSGKIEAWQDITIKEKLKKFMRKS